MSHLPEIKPYEQAIWDWFLPQAVVPDIYSGKDDKLTREVHKHLETCGIDYERSQVPEVGTFDQFDGTFAEDKQVAGIVVDRWNCRCDQDDDAQDPISWHSFGQLVVQGEFSLARIIYEVVQGGLGTNVAKGEGDGRGHRAR